MKKPINLKDIPWPNGKRPMNATVSQWAAELGLSRQSIERGLRSIDHQWRQGEKLPARIIFKALTGDLDAAKARLAQADAELKENKLQERLGKLVEVDAIEKMLHEVMTPITQRLDALPSEAAHECNPTDPQFAKAALERWVARSKPIIRDWGKSRKKA